MLLGFLCLLNLNILVNSNENTNDQNAKGDLSFLNGLDDNVHSKMSSLIYFYSSKADAYSSNADFIQNKFTRAMKYVEKASHLEFECALSHMKSTTNYCYELFELKQEDLEAEDKIEYPVGFEDRYIKDADQGSYGNINIFYKTDRMKDSYWLWHKLASGNTHCNIKSHEKMTKALKDYYLKHQSFHKQDPNYSSLENFHKHYAATITRAYKLGCMFEHTLKNAFDKKWESDGNQSQRPRFSEVLLKFLPKWDFTEEDMSLINLTWETCGINFSLLKGIEVTNEYNKKVIIPRLDACYTEPRDISNFQE